MIAAIYARTILGKLGIGIVAFTLGSAAAAAYGARVEVTFYRSPTPTVWCYLSEGSYSVECIDDPCQGYRYQVQTAKGEAETAKAEAARLSTEVDTARSAAAAARRDVQRAQAEVERLRKLLRPQ